MVLVTCLSSEPMCNFRIAQNTPKIACTYFDETSFHMKSCIQSGTRETPKYLGLSLRFSESPCGLLIRRSLPFELRMQEHVSLDSVE